MKNIITFKIKWTTKVKSDLKTNKYILVEIKLKVIKKKFMKTNNKSANGDNGDSVGDS